MTDTADLASLLLQANRAVESVMLLRLAQVGIPGLRMGHLTLLRVLPPDGSGRVSELADAAGVTRQAIGQIVAELVELAVVEVHVDQADRRARTVGYTEYGRRGYETAMQEFGAIEGELAAALGARRLATLKSALRAVTQAAGQTAGHAVTSP
jgi:DNA-binding MarR family transcriptional regulator